MVKLGKSLGFLVFDVGDQVEDLKRVDVLQVQQELQDQRLAEYGTAEIPDAEWRKLLARVAMQALGGEEADWSNARVLAFWDEVSAEAKRVKKVVPGLATPD